MVHYNLITLALIALTITSALSSNFRPLGIEDLTKQESSLSQTRKGWKPYTFFGQKSNGTTQVLHFDSLNAQVTAIFYDPGLQICYTQAIINQTGWGLIDGVDNPALCANGTFTKIDKDGRLLFIRGSGQYIYMTNQGDFSDRMQIQGNLSQAVLENIEFGLTKSTEFYSNQYNDYFRVFSRASDINGNYPTSFYALIANSTGNTFTNGSHNTLTLKKFAWTFKNTSIRISFTKIDQVNFVADHEHDYVLEGQWITGKGRISDISERLDQVASKPVCQYGAVNTKQFSEDESSNNPSMYAIGLHFPCNLKPTAARTYQGIVSFTDSLNYFYSINPDTGVLQVCTTSARYFEDIKSMADFTDMCASIYKIRLVLKANEYYSAVTVLGAYATELTVVNIKDKTNKASLRQVVVGIGNGDLPTFDTGTYFYSVYQKTIWRIKKKFQPGDTLQTSYYTPTSLSEKEKSKKEPVSEKDDVEAVIF